MKQKQKERERERERKEDVSICVVDFETGKMEEKEKKSILSTRRRRKYLSLF